MYKYAQLNGENFVVGISYLSGVVTADNMILINELDVELGSTYNHKTGEFTPPEPQPEPEEEHTIEERILIETQYQTILLEMGTMF